MEDKLDVRDEGEGAARNLYVGGRNIGAGRRKRSLLLSSDLMQQLQACFDQAVSITAETIAEKEWVVPSSDRTSEPRQRSSLLFDFSVLAISQELSSSLTSVFFVKS